MPNSKKIAGSLLGQDLTSEECDVLATIVKIRQLQPAEVLFEAGSKDDILYLLITGKLEVLNVFPGGNTISIDVLQEGSMTGELTFVDGVAHTMRVIAKKDSEVLMLHRDEFESLVENHPLLTYHVMRSILRYSHTLQRKINSKYLEMYRMVQNQYTAHY
ncbi:MAG: cyclic nucleotide-binding domain-containing protein [Thiotrichales bacterium]|nr:cyclic nucleotide-binding domain-containing protein [Thiotrichales bacterium]